MFELRDGIDAVDRQLVALLARRVGYIDRAAEIKTGIGMPARVPDRVEDVVRKVKAEANKAGLDSDLAEQIWRGMIEWSIAREEKVLGSSE
jgi:isochorismate pyruvate lyase